MEKLKPKTSNKFLSISNELVRVRDKDEMLYLIQTSFKRFIDFDDSLILKYNAEQKTYRPFIFNAEHSLLALSDLDHLAQLAEWNSVDVTVETSPRLLKIEDKESKYDQLSAYLHKAGINELVSLNLIEGNRLIGLLILLSKKGRTFKSEALDLLRQLSPSISIITANIIANEEIAQREVERKLLLGVSNVIAALNRRGDLFKVVNDKLKQLLCVQHVVFTKKDEDGKTISIFLEEFQENFTGHPDHDEIFAGHYSIDDPIHTFILRSEDPVLIVTQEWLDKPDIPVYIYFCRDAGIERMLASALRVGGTIVGEVFFMLENHVEINPTSILVKGVCSQLAVAVSNILANERVLAREAEKNLLLNLSNEIAALKSREELFALVDGKIKQLFSVQDFIFAKRDEDGKTFSALLTELKPEIKNHPDHDLIMEDRYSANDPILSIIIQSEDPVTIVADEWINKPDMPAHVYFWRDAGIKRMLASALRVGGKEIGLIFFILDDKVQINPNGILIKGVCSQLAVAVSNILSNEKIREREAEKTRLLEFSNAMASARDKKVLGKILKQQLKELFGIEDYVIHGLSKDKKFHRPILLDLETDYAQHPEFIKLMETDIDVNDGVFNKILTAKDLVMFNAEEWYSSDAPPVYANVAQSIGLKKMAGIAIRLGEESIGVMNFRKDGTDDFAIQQPLFKSICSQIAIALSNILANDEANRHLAEIERYKQQLEEEKVYLQEEIDTTHSSEIIGNSPEIRKVLRLVGQVAPSDSTVLLLGETGTGKELVARAIHNNSRRREKLMIKINCAALPSNLIESELFGHERGAFTGAVERRIGKFELANRGTLFLDEIGEMPLELQSKLLRALQEKEIERLGGKTTIKVDVRIIAATNRDLEKMISEGSFRTDLYYRLNIFPIHIPALRTRKEDIPILAAKFIKRYSKKAGKGITKLSNRALQELIDYRWPGNIRELEHLIERSILLSNGDIIKEVSLPVQQSKSSHTSAEESFNPQNLADIEKEYILKVLKHVKGKISGEGGAAQLLGVPSTTLHSKIKKLGIRREHNG